MQSIVYLAGCNTGRAGDSSRRYAPPTMKIVSIGGGPAVNGAMVIYAVIWAW